MSNELITISATKVKALDKATLYNCEGDQEWFPNSLVSFNEKKQELTAPKWLLNSKFPGEF